MSGHGLLHGRLEGRWVFFAATMGVGMAVGLWGVGSTARG